MNTIVIANSKSCPVEVYSDIRKILIPLGLLSPDWLPITNNLFGAFLELKLTKYRLDKRLACVLNEGSPDLHHYLPELSRLKFNGSFLLELEDKELFVDFKAFLIFVKGVLDRLVPFYDKCFGSKMNVFSKSGKRLLNYLKQNHRQTSPKPLIDLVLRHKKGWIDQVISVRDELTHFSTVEEYRSFHYVVTHKSIAQLRNPADMNPPTLYFGRESVRVSDYLTSIYTGCLQFSEGFVAFCAEK